MMDKNIIAFIKSERNLTICTVSDNAPYCASCFYTFLTEENMLVFKSERTTKHISNALQNKRVAGTIIPDIRLTGDIKGIQFVGRFIVPDSKLLMSLSKSYYFKFPFALTMNGQLWAIELQEIKFTDNTLGFGKKLVWKKEDSTNAIFENETSQAS